MYTNSCEGSGYADIIIPKEYKGYNTIHVEAYDNYNNRSYHSINLNILNENHQNHLIDSFLALPNPFKENTYFTIQISNTNLLPIDLELKIFDLNGKLIKSLDIKNIEETFKTISWNATDNKNRKIANGTYIVHINAQSTNGDSEIKKYMITKIK